MRLLITTTILALFLASGTALAEDIVFIGKTFSPNHMEVMSPHATEQELKEFKKLADELKAKQGDNAEPPIGPFTGRMKVTKLLAGIGQKVDEEQALLEYTYPPEDLISERRKLSQVDLISLEATLERVRSDMAATRRSLDDARARHSRGMASDQELSDLARNLQVAELKEQAIAYRLHMDREMAAGDLELAKAKFGKKTDEHHLGGTSWITSPVEGYVLWTNPEVKPGVVLTKSTRLFVVGSLDPIILRAWVHEIHATRLRVGDKAKVTFEVLPGRTFEATISRIPMTAIQFDVQLPSEYEVELTMANPDLALKEGMRGQVTVQVPDGPRG